MSADSKYPSSTSRASLAPARRSAWIALFWERCWPLLLPVLGVLAVFLIVSWFGVWAHLHDYVRLAAVAGFAVIFVMALLFLRKLRFPTTQDVDARIERASQLDHRPVTAQVDSRSNVTGGDDPFAKALWEEHRRRMAQSLTGLKSGTPSPKIAYRDPFALRALVLLFLFVAFGAGWNNWGARIADAFRSQPISALVAGRVDVWVTPPAYTNKPPIFLKQSENEQQAAVTVPEGSELVVRVLKLDAPELVLLDGEYERVIDAEKPEDSDKAANDTKAETEIDAVQLSQTFKLKLGKSSSVKLRSGEEEVGTWSFAVTEDHDPSIKFTEDPSGSTRGALEFSYEVQDDYGVATAQAEILSEQDRDAQAVPLVEAPEVDLPLPRRNAKKGVSKTSQDLTSHPWAGAQVRMTLNVEDEAGQKGKSETKSFVLPERIFTEPLAKAIVDERRNLALDLRNAPQVAEMLDIITTTHPDEFIKNFSVYTALRVAYRSIKRSRDKDELRETLDLMWETALAVEDGDLSLAERRLRDAQERLAKALENGASDEEIAELMQDLRNAMNEFMQELAEQAQRNQQNQQAMPMDPNTQVLRQQDLERMMQQIEDLAKSGSKDAARQLLEEMQRMMNNLQTARPQQQQQQTDEFSQQMNKLGEMMRQQQQLMDQTMDMQRQQQQRREQGQQQQNQQQQQRQQGQQQQGQQGERKPMTPEEFAEAMKQLQQQQGELQQQMEGLQEAMRGLGMEPGEGLGEAGEAMGGAEQSLGEGQTGEAMGEQGRALQAMRQGAQQMMQNMQNQAGEQGRQGERGQHGEQSSGDRDPLGRQSRSEGPQLGDDTKVPGEIDAQRAREILEAIRRKLSDPARPKLELDYLDRLLPSR